MLSSDDTVCVGHFSEKASIEENFMLMINKVIAAVDNGFMMCAECVVII